MMTMKTMKTTKMKTSPLLKRFRTPPHPQPHQPHYMARRIRLCLSRYHRICNSTSSLALRVLFLILNVIPFVKPKIKIFFSTVSISLSISVSHNITESSVINIIIITITLTTPTLTTRG